MPSLYLLQQITLSLLSKHVPKILFWRRDVLQRTDFAETTKHHKQGVLIYRYLLEREAKRWMKTDLIISIWRRNEKQMEGDGSLGFRQPDALWEMSLMKDVMLPGHGTGRGGSLSFKICPCIHGLWKFSQGTGKRIRPNKLCSYVSSRRKPEGFLFIPFKLVSRGMRQ